MKSDTLSNLSHHQIAQLVAPMHAASWRATYRGIFDDAYLDHQVDADRLQYWQTRVPQLATGVGEIFLATVAGVPAGFLCIEIGPERSSGAFLDNLHVLPHVRGQGVGKLLVDAASRWALKHGESQLYLLVYEDNLQARQFYAHEGWRAVARKMDDLPGGGQAAVLKLIKPLG
jgi:GNAT superfamily N-acetyltransferase